MHYHMLQTCTVVKMENGINPTWASTKKYVPEWMHLVWGPWVVI